MTKEKITLIQKYPLKGTTPNNYITIDLFGIEKCAMLVMKSGKRHMTDGIELANQEKLERSEKKKNTNAWSIGC